MKKKKGEWPQKKVREQGTEFSHRAFFLRRGLDCLLGTRENRASKKPGEENECKNKEEERRKIMPRRSRSAESKSNPVPVSVTGARRSRVFVLSDFEKQPVTTAKLGKRGFGTMVVVILCFVALRRVF